MENPGNLQDYGRFGDTMLAHISPEEAHLLRQHGGSGTINPHTGLPEFFSWKKLAGAILPHLGFVGGAANALIQGGGVREAIKGGIGSGIETAASMLAPGVGETLGIGTALAGGLTGAGGGALNSLINGGKPLSGALAGGVSGYLGNGGFGDLANGLGGGGALSSLSSGAPSAADASLPWAANAAPTIDTSLPWISSNPAYASYGNMVNNGQLAAPSSIGGDSSSGNSGNLIGNLVKRAASSPISTLSSALQIAGSLNGQNDKNVNAVSQQDIVGNMKAEQAKEAAYADAMRSSLNTSSLDRRQVDVPVDYYTYGQGPQKKFYDNVNPRIQFKKGGLASLGGGQDDDVPADLSEGEFVMPADVVSHLGDGNTAAGGKKLSHMVNAVRQHKSVKGMPPKAKMPQAYLPKSKGALGALTA